MKPSRKRAAQTPSPIARRCSQLQLPHHVSLLGHVACLVACMLSICTMAPAFAKNLVQLEHKVPWCKIAAQLVMYVVMFCVSVHALQQHSDCFAPVVFVCTVPSMSCWCTGLGTVYPYFFATPLSTLLCLFLLSLAPSLSSSVIIVV